MHTRRVRIENFLSFDEFEWNTGAKGLHVFVGPNGGGKTNFFRALSAVQAALHEGVAGPWEQASHHPDSPDFSIELDVEFDAPLERELLTALVRGAFARTSAPIGRTERRWSQALREKMRPEHLNRPGFNGDLVH